MNRPKIAIIGVGAVGSAAAYALILNRTNAQVMLIDIDQERCKGEVDDLQDAAAFCGSTSVEQASTKQAAQADIIIIAAGQPQKPNQPRTELVAANKKIIESIFAELAPIESHAIIIMVTNPVDIMTYYAQQLSGLPQNQVFGTGTFLDSQRLRVALSEFIHISEKSIHLYILGEHGDSQVVAWSCARIAGIPATDFPGITPKLRHELAEKTRTKAYDIIACKGATSYGIATCIATLCRTILGDEHRITPLSCYDEQFKICLSRPAVLGRSGLQKVLNIPLSPEEFAAYTLSANNLRSLVK